MLFEERRQIDRERWYPSAQICSLLANIHRTEDADAFTIADFVPGGLTGDDEVIPGISREMKEFIDAIEDGETFELAPERLAEFKRDLEGKFKNVVPGVSDTGPSGKRETFL